MASSKIKKNIKNLIYQYISSGRYLQFLNALVYLMKDLLLACRGVINEFGQYRLQLSSDCTYRCLDCRWWDHRKAIVLNINLNSFAYIKPAAIVNVFGGDPVIHPDFQQVLSALLDRTARVRLWSTGLGNLDQWLTIVPLLDRLYLYVPSGDPEQYQAFVGTSTWSQLRLMIQQFSAVSNNIWLNYEARADTVQFLPEVYELAYEYGCRLLIQCDQSKFFDQDSLLCIKRFYRVAHVELYFTTQKSSVTRCSGVSAVVTNGGWQLLKNKGYELINRMV